MRYLLVLGFACDVYRREPRARIFVGDKLIDEFFIQHHIDTMNTTRKNFWSNRQILEPFSEDKLKNIMIKNYPPLRFYSVEIGTPLHRTELRIEIENSDSNNSNGFITKSTLIKLQVCFFFPLHQKLLLRLAEIRNKNRLTQNYSWYCLNENFLFDIVRNGLCWHEKNGQIFNPKKYNLASYQIGGDGVFTSELVKKYQVLINKTKKPYRFNFDSFTIDYLLNKYMEYENQRNCN